ncbi:hypothetical protein UPYG_G00308630 [Umbra pygmaea]|uniref:Fanconi anemia group B protein n=1 Tax=Umbra pygmaea TaxID=75934 RepID=A0ABD0VZ08_UMBPY
MEFNLSYRIKDNVTILQGPTALWRHEGVIFYTSLQAEVCSLPFEDPEHIETVHTGRNGCLFVISFKNEHICAVWKDTFQVASCWSGVSSIHVDDFVGCGSDQLLLVFRSQGAPGSPVDNFLITDLCGTTYSHGQKGSEGPNTSDPASENYLLTVQALQSRLQSGLTVLQDLQRDEQVKERVLRQSIQALIDMVSGKQHVLTQTEQEDLVSLWDEDEEEAVEEERRAVTEVPHLVEKLWHRVIEDRLIVGVILTKESAISVENVTLSILADQGQSQAPAVIQTQSRRSWFTPPRHSHPEPAAKRSRPDGAGDRGASDTATHRLAVTAVTDLTSLLTSASVKCPVMLHYIQRRESSGATTAPGPSVVQCGQVQVDIQGKQPLQLLNNSQLKTDEAVEDLLSLLAMLDSWSFVIASLDHTLCDVAGWIERSIPCERLEISPHYLLANPAGPSAAMLFLWQRTTPFQGTLSVYSSQFQLLRFLDSLCAFLPASYSVRHITRGKGDRTSPQLALCLEKEVQLLRQGVSSLLCGEEDENDWRKSNGGRNAETPDPSSAVGLQACREEWQRASMRSRRSLSPLVAIERYRTLTQSLAQVQQEADQAALLETQIPAQ